MYLWLSGKRHICGNCYVLVYTASVTWVCTTVCDGVLLRRHITDNVFSKQHTQKLLCCYHYLFLLPMALWPISWPLPPMFSSSSDTYMWLLHAKFLVLINLQACFFIFLCIPQLSGRPSSCETSSQNSFWDFVVEHPYYIPNPLQSFNKHVCYKVNVCTPSLQFFILPYFLDAINIYWCKNYPEDFSVILCSTLTNCPCFTPTQNSWPVYCKY